MAQVIDKIQWVKPPLQTRSQDNLQRMLDAAEEIIAAKGFEQATVSEIVRQAGTSVGAFYGRFREKDALLGCLHDRFCEEAYATIDSVLDPARWEGCTAEEIVSATIPFLVEVYRQRVDLIRAFIMRGASDDDFCRRWLPLNAHLTGSFRDLLLMRSEAISHFEPSLAIEMALQMTLSTLDRLTLFRVEEVGVIELDDPRLPRELVRAVLSYLGVDGPPLEFRHDANHTEPGT